MYEKEVLSHVLQRESLVVQALDVLRQAILTHQIPPGSPINIRHVARQLGVSPIPIREALRRLEAEGLLVFAGNRIVVTKLSRAELEDIYSIRIPLENLVVKKIFSSGVPPDLSRLEDLHQKMCQPEVTGAEWFALNRLFHMELHSLAQSPRLFSILQGLWNSTGPYLRIFSEDKKAVKRANEEHQKIIEGLTRGDRGLVCSTLTRHLRNGLRVLRRLVPE